MDHPPGAHKKSKKTKRGVLTPHEKKTRSRDSTFLPDVNSWIQSGSVCQEYPVDFLRTIHESFQQGLQTALQRWQPKRLEILIIGAVLVVKVSIPGVIVAVRRWRGSVRLVVRVLRVLLALADLRPMGVCVLPRLVEAVRDEDVVEDRARVHGPQLEADRANVVVRVHVLHELLVRDLLRLPDALVRRVIDALRIPIALVVRVVDLRRLPLAILVVIPVVGLRRLRVVDLLAQ